MSTASLRRLRWPDQWAQNPLRRSARGPNQWTFDSIISQNFVVILSEMDDLHQILTFHKNILEGLIKEIPDQALATMPWDFFA